MHKKTAIRQYIYSVLAATQTAAGNVHLAPIKANEQLSTPAIVIHFASTSEHDEQFIGDDQVRTLALMIEISNTCEDAEDGTPCDVQETLDQVELETEQALHIDREMGGLVNDLVFTESETQMEGDAAYKTAICILHYTITYTVNRKNPEV